MPCGRSLCAAGTAGYARPTTGVTEIDRPGTLELTVVNGPSRPTTLFTLKSLGVSLTQVTYTVDVKPLLWPFTRTRLGADEAFTEAANIRNLPTAMDASVRRPG